MLQGWPARQHTGRCEVSREVAAWSGHGSKGLSHFVAALSGLRREFLGHLSTALSELWRSICALRETWPQAAALPGRWQTCSYVGTLTSEC